MCGQRCDVDAGECGGVVGWWGKKAEMRCRCYEGEAVMWGVSGGEADHSGEGGLVVLMAGALSRCSREADAPRLLISHHLPSSRCTAQRQRSAGHGRYAVRSLKVSVSDFIKSGRLFVARLHVDCRH